MEQAAKYHLSLAGEYYVAAELQRRNVQASITYGNAKQTDVVAFCPSSSRAVVIEVKSTTKDSWVVGGQVPPNDDKPKPWVFVHVSVEPSHAPRFYVLMQSELHDILTPIDAAYRDRFQTKHGREFDGAGVVTLRLKDAEPYANKWEKIIALVNAV
jgi:hypothetical protein